MFADQVPPHQLPVESAINGPESTSRDEIAFVGRAAISGHDPETAGTSNINTLLNNMLEPARLEAERQRLLREETDPDFEDRYISGARYGYMEAKPDSLKVRPSDPRSNTLLGQIQASPRFTRRTFFDVAAAGLLRGEQNRTIVIESMVRDLPLELPLDNFVYASRFLSWKEGRGAYVDKVEDNHEAIKRSSHETIEAYKQRTTPAPPIEAVVGFVQPNGIIFFATERGSHRTGAAVARGDTIIKTKKLQLIPIEQDYFALSETVLPDIR